MEIGCYISPSPVSTALEQLVSTGKSLRPGQSVRLIYTLGIPRVHAWHVDTDFDLRTVKVPRYRRLLDCAINAVLDPITGTDDSWLTQILQLKFDI